MKKRICASLCMLLIAAVILTGCGKGGDYIKTLLWKINLLCRNRHEINLHIPCFCQTPCCFDLFRRNICSCPVRSIPIHIAGKNTGTCSQVQDLLSLYTETSVNDLLVKHIRIDVSVLCIIPGSSSPVKSFSGIDPAVCYQHAYAILISLLISSSGCFYLEAAFVFALPVPDCDDIIISLVSKTMIFVY